MGADDDSDLLEREHELRALAAAVDAAAGGRGRAVLVEAGAGGGKTRLADAAATRAAAAGLRVLRARGAAVEQAFVFGVVRQLLERPALELDDATTGAARLGLAALAVPDPAAPPPEPTHGLLHGLYWLLAGLAERGPLALVVDDAHWADGPSLRALAHVARRIEGLPLLLVVAARDDDVPELDQLRRDETTVRLSPRPLGPAATGQLLEQLAGVPCAPEAAAVAHRVSGGNPFLLRETVLALRRNGQPPDADAIRALAVSAPASLRRQVTLRLTALGPEAVAVARAVAVLDQDAGLTRVAALAALPRATAAAAVGRLAAAEILADGEPQRFVHPLVRAAVDADLATVDRALLHERAGRLLRAQDADPAQVAAHFLLSWPGGDAEVAACLHEAGRDALAKGAPAIAVEHLRRAWSEPPAGERAGAVLHDLGRAELALGDPAAAAGRFADALARATAPADRAALALDLARAHVERGAPDAAVQVLDDAGAALAGELALRLRVERTTLALYVPAQAAAAQREMARHVRLAGTTPSERLALANAALALAFDPRQTADLVLDVARRALARGELARQAGTDAPAWGQACYAALFAEDYETVERESDLALDEARRRGSPMALVSGWLGHLFVRFPRGDLPGAVAAGDALLAAADDLPRSVIAARWVSAGARLLAEALVQSGAPERAADVLARCEELGDLDQPDLVLLRLGRAAVAEAAGDHDHALAEATRFGEVAAAVGYVERNAPWRLVAARAAFALGDVEHAQQLADEAVALTRRWGAPGGLGVALRTRALVGPAERRTARLEEAVDRLRGTPLALERAAALVDLGIAQRREGRRRDARETLTEGMDGAARCGALPLAELARTELHVLGARPRRHRATGAQSLTATQLRVAEMIAEGRTNREIAQAAFITQKTAETHVSAVLRKLEVRSRHEVAARLAEAAPTAPAAPTADRPAAPTD